MSAFFLDIPQRTEEVFRAYFALTQAASDHLGREVEAVTKIQSVYRASKIRRSWHAVVGSTLLIQRAVRGWSGRRRAKIARFQRQRQLQWVFFHQAAVGLLRAGRSHGVLEPEVVMQRTFRGWWSRRHLHDYGGRKKYVQKCAKRGEWTTTYLDHEHQEKLAVAKMEEEQRMRQEFCSVAGEIHHLVSTKSIPGIYNPPYNDHLPRAFDKPIEQHLREALRVQLPRSLRRPRHRAAAHIGARLGVSQREMQAMADGMTSPPQDLPERAPCVFRTASSGRLQKVQGPFRSKEQIEVANVKVTAVRLAEKYSKRELAAHLYRSVQASTPWHQEAEDRVMQNRLAKMLRTSPEDFKAPGKPAERPVQASINASVPYVEKPFELRNDYLELPKIRDKPPFYTAFPNNKNFEELNEQPMVPSGHV